MTLEPFRLERDRIVLLDQTLLPAREVWIEIPDATSMTEAIAKLRVRGAPAIGIAAALALAIEASRGEAIAARLASLAQAGERLVAARPTAVNLAWAVERVLRAARIAADTPDMTAEAWGNRVREEALAIWDEDRAASRAMAEHAASLFPTERRFLTHCNTGALATGGGGTALAAIRAIHRRRTGGIEVWMTETRPLLQGARLTAWELQREGIPGRLIADGAAAHTILREGIEAVLVGADRIARNGDTANKIGTLGLALAAREARIPLVVVAPSSTVDLALETGEGIRIEERDPAEVTHVGGVPIAPSGFAARNPAFDVTPGAWIAAIVTERGISRSPHHALGALTGERAGW